MKSIHLLIKPASGNCNLKCQYCFYHDVSKHRKQSLYGRMSEETLENVIKKALDYAEQECTIAFQGGEPTIRGLDFYKKVIVLERKYNKKGINILNSIQTNGYQLNEEWAIFFAENKFLVGISLDGRKNTHNAYRKNGNGEDTFYDVLGTIKLFDKFNVEYNILTVINSMTVKYPKKIYEFYKKNKWRYLQFIPCLNPLDDTDRTHCFSLDPEEYGVFLCELFDCWYEDLQLGEQPYIRQFENYIAILMGCVPESCDKMGICGNQVVVEADGKAYPCDFYVMDEYCLGDLNYIGIEELNNKRREIGFIEYSINDHDQCPQCQYYFICRGGCRRHRLGYDENGVHVNQFCRSYQVFFENALVRMEQIASVLKNK